MKKPYAIIFLVFTALIACKKEEPIPPPPSALEVFRAGLIGRWAEVNYYENSYLPGSYVADDTIAFFEDGRCTFSNYHATHFSVEELDSVQLYTLEGTDTTARNSLYISRTIDKNQMSIRFSDTTGLIQFRPNWTRQFYERIN